MATRVETSPFTGVSPDDDQLLTLDANEGFYRLYMDAILFGPLPSSLSDCRPPTAFPVATWPSIVRVNATPATPIAELAASRASVLVPRCLPAGGIVSSRLLTLATRSVRGSVKTAVAELRVAIVARLPPR